MTAGLGVEPDVLAARRQPTTALGYAQLLRAVENDPHIPPSDLAKGSVYVCGVGQLPVALLLAVADVEDGPG